MSKALNIFKILAKFISLVNGPLTPSPGPFSAQKSPGTNVPSRHVHMMHFIQCLLPLAPYLFKINCLTDFLPYDQNKDQIDYYQSDIDQK